MTMRFWIIPVALTCCLVAADVAKADISFSYVTDQASYAATTAGQSITVSIYLNENLSNGGTDIEQPNQGLVGAGFYVTQTGSVPAGATTISAIGGNANTNDPANPGQPGDGFNGGSGASISKQVTPGGGSASVNEGTNDVPGPVGATNSNGTQLQLLLGTVTLKAGAAGTTTSFTLESYVNRPKSNGGSGVNGNTVDYGGNDYDVGGTDPTTGQSFTGANQLPFETFTVTTAAVPEPSSMLLSALFVPVAGLGVWLRRRKAVTAAA